MKKIFTNAAKIIASAGLLLSCVSCAEETEDLGGAFSGARLAFAGKMTLIGLGAIFAVLAILWGAIEVFHFFLEKGNKKSETAANGNSQEPTVAPVQPQAQTDDGQLVAVISAAVAAYLDAESSDGTNSKGFRVVSFKRVGQSDNAK